MVENKTIHISKPTLIFIIASVLLFVVTIVISIFSSYNFTFTGSSNSGNNVAYHS